MALNQFCLRIFGASLQIRSQPGLLGGAAVTAAILLSGCRRTLNPPQADDLKHPLSRGLSSERLTNAHFLPDKRFPEFPPEIALVKFPIQPGDFAIWGATGRDDAGHIWFATSAYQHPTLTARLYEYDPTSGSVTPRGDVLDELAKAGLLQKGEEQPKIHTKIIQAGDGHLYFASMDEPRKGEVGERPPPWGSHLWRLRLPERRWEHLLRAEEGLIALAGGGGYVFALGFPDHTLLRYDIASGAVKRLAVGSVEGHISRNLFTDSRGHVYVPRLRAVRADHADHLLVEFNQDLLELGQNAISNYQYGAAEQCHGIIAFQQLADGSVVFTTHAGRLLQVVPQKAGPSKLVDLGWFHPDGKAYAPSLFTESGSRDLYGIARREWDGGEAFVWVHYDLSRRWSEAIPMTLPRDDGAPPSSPLLYGCQAVDNAGGFYVVGCWRTPVGVKPVVLRITGNGYE
jgi:hypothetical protein